MEKVEYLKDVEDGRAGMSIRKDRQSKRSESPKTREERCRVGTVHTQTRHKRQPKQMTTFSANIFKDKWNSAGSHRAP